jgi:oxalate---CoA ligase
MTAEASLEGRDRLHSVILRIWSRLLETADLSIDDDFFDKGGDSLLATELMLELRRLTGKELPDSLLFESSTVRALAQRLSQKEVPQARAAVRIGEASKGAKPLIFFHGDWTRGGFYLEHLARKLGPEYLLVAIAPHGAGGEPIPSSIEAMAADRLRAILEVQPTGPYRLAGHCVGGIVALETARLLMKLNHRVETIVMIDSPLMVGGEAVRSPRWETEGGDEPSVPNSEDVPVRPVTPEIDWGIERYTERLAAYAPAPLPVSAPLLVIAGEYDGRVWLRLSDHAALQEVHGVHFDLVTWRIDDLASRLRLWLSGNRSAGSSERRPFAQVSREQSFPPTGSNKRSQQSPHRGHEDKAPVHGGSDEEIGSPLVKPTKNASFSLRLRRFFNYAR